LTSLHYNVTSNNKIGNPDDKTSLAIFFYGLHFLQNRITNLTKEQSGQIMFKKAELRQKGQIHEGEQTKTKVIYEIRNEKYI
jgi:hypothetical protein